MERQKSIVEEADNAQRTFLILKRLDLINTRLAAIEGAGINFVGHESPDINPEVEAQVLRLTREASNVDAYIEALTDLANELHKTPKDRKKLRNIQGQRDEMRSSLRKLETRDDEGESLDVLKPEITNTLNRQASIEHNIRVFSGELLERLGEEKKDISLKNCDLLVRIVGPTVHRLSNTV